jgi:BirA family biotin operon repressor/biotin-[acetyl-CoA-carboxylase] ligase
VIGNSQAARIVLASRQTKGRGRDGKTWWSPPGAVAVTFILPATHPPHEVSMRVAVAVRDVLSNALRDDVELTLKWPNDVLDSRGRKIAGILCHRLGRVDLIGIGINANVRCSDAPGGLRDKIGSLHELARREIDQTDLVASLTAPLVPDAQKTPFVDVLNRYRAADALLKRRIELRLADGRKISGIADGIDDSARLILRSDNGLQPIASGHIERWTNVGG